MRRAKGGCSPPPPARRGSAEGSAQFVFECAIERDHAQASAFGQQRTHQRAPQRLPHRLDQQHRILVSRRHVEQGLENALRDRESKPARAKAAATSSALRPGSTPSAPVLPPAWDGSPPAGRANASSPAGSAIRGHAASPLPPDVWPAPRSGQPRHSLRPEPDSAAPAESTPRRRRRLAPWSRLPASGRGDPSELMASRLS